MPLKSENFKASEFFQANLLTGYTHVSKHLTEVSFCISNLVSNKIYTKEHDTKFTDYLTSTKPPAS